MEIRWTYILLLLLYGVVLALRALDRTINKREDIEKDSLTFYIYKQDFFTTVAMSCIAITALINLAALIGGRPLNLDSIYITILVVGGALLDGITKVYVTQDERIAISGYLFSKEEIEQLKIKKNGRVNISLNEYFKGYDTITLYILNSNKLEITQTLKNIYKKDA